MNLRPRSWNMCVRRISHGWKAGTLCLSMRYCKTKLKHACASCFAFLRVSREWLRGGRRRVVKLYVSPRGFVCLDKKCLQSERETQCLRLRRLSAGGGKGLGIASPRGCCMTLERRFRVVSHARRRRAAADLIATAHSARPGI